MPPRYGRSIAQVRYQRRPRPTLWGTVNFTDNGKASNVVTTHDALTDLEVAGVGLYASTIMRQRIAVAFAPGGAGDSAVFGIVVAPSTMTSAELNPTLAPDLDWMLLRKIFPDASGATVDATLHYDIDLRSRRRLRQRNDTLWYVWQSLTTSSTSLNVFARVLLRLP